MDFFPGGGGEGQLLPTAGAYEQKWLSKAQYFRKLFIT